MVTRWDTCQQLWPQPWLHTLHTPRSRWLTRRSTFLWLWTDRDWILLKIFSPIIKFWYQRWWQSWRGLLSWNPICYPWPGGDQGETLLWVSQRTGQIKTKDVIQEFHPMGFNNNKEAKTSKVIINARSVLVLPSLSWHRDVDWGWWHALPGLVFTMFHVWQLFCS